MISRAAGSHGSGALDQIRAQILHLKARYLVDKVASAFPNIQLVHHIGVVGDVYIGFVTAVKNPPVMAADLAARRHLNDQQRAAIYCADFRPQVQRRIDLLAIIDGRHEVLFQAVRRIRIHAQNHPAVFDAQDDRSAVSVRERADGIINIPCYLSGGSLKFHLDVFAALNQFQKFDFCHRSNPFHVVSCFLSI